MMPSDAGNSRNAIVSIFAWGARGRKFESCRPDQFKINHLRSGLPLPKPSRKSVGIPFGTPLFDATERLRRHVEASEKRDLWARRAIDLLKKGKEKAGLEAAEKAERWDLTANSLADLNH